MRTLIFALFCLAVGVAKSSALPSSNPTEVKKPGPITHMLENPNILNRDLPLLVHHRHTPVSGNTEEPPVLGNRKSTELAVDNLFKKQGIRPGPLDHGADRAESRLFKEKSVGSPTTLGRPTLPPIAKILSAQHNGGHEGDIGFAELSSEYPSIPLATMLNIRD
ncbi:hypothetical protein F5148DRAFT_1174863 [Russula earlei]|uniref:Uncharacterized protein n=1 Tax=Russula earlei TaxID=71964 RepID=A0ACC0UJF5_9AGAM|nr:hypothetical protein F5148DRAFT_1174863 [Russula earlei]